MISLRPLPRSRRHALHCLGAPLARIETKIALRNLLDRNPNLRLAVALEELEETTIPTLASYQKLPMIFG